MIVKLKQPIKTLSGQSIGTVGGLLADLLIGQSSNNKEQILSDYELAVQIKDLNEKEFDIDEVAKFRKLVIESQGLNILAKAQLLKTLV